MPINVANYSDVFRVVENTFGGQLSGVRAFGGQVLKFSVFAGMELLGFFDSVHMGRCKIPSAMNDPDDIHLIPFEFVENPV